MCRNLRVLRISCYQLVGSVFELYGLRIGEYVLQIRTDDLTETYEPQVSQFGQPLSGKNCDITTLKTQFLNVMHIYVNRVEELVFNGKTVSDQFECLQMVIGIQCSKKVQSVFIDNIYCQTLHLKMISLFLLNIQIISNNFLYYNSRFFAYHIIIQLPCDKSKSNQLFKK